jgi:hypothetical protein
VRIADIEPVALSPVTRPDTAIRWVRVANVELLALARLYVILVRDRFFPSASV